MKSSPVWIPPWALVGGQLAHGLSWLLLAWLGWERLLGPSLPGLAWVHLVALGWLTLIALAVLVHVFKGVLDVTWRGEAIARWALLPFALGTAGMVASFWAGALQPLAWAASLVGAGLVGYLVPAAATLASFRASEDASPAVARAFALVLVMLALAAKLGLGMAWGLASGSFPTLLAVGPAVHAHLGGVGWLTLLVMGVSVRTVRRISGSGPTQPWLHIGASTAVLAGLAGLTLGLGLGLPLVSGVGGAACALGACLNLVDLALRLKAGSEPHLPPQAFIGASAVYFVGAAVAGLMAWAGHPGWQAAYVFLGLMGWLGQMVNGHMLHIGIRVLATVARGDDDETEPIDILAPWLSWGSWAAAQLAVVGVTAGLVWNQGAW
ncbi:MAG: hypothetical protein JWM80_3897, partial [Cyanobacteria bacterium RYN_339]|nr:hypothetical protein [Cyanobacteria bacterium RYN_339]